MDLSKKRMIRLVTASSPGKRWQAWQAKHGAWSIDSETGAPTRSGHRPSAGHPGATSQQSSGDAKLPGAWFKDGEGC